NGSSTTAIAGGLTTSRVVDITPHGNLAYIDTVSGSNGLYAINGLPSVQTAATPVITMPSTASPNDFSISPDVQTVYIADDENFSTGSGTGGIQRWDNVGGSYILSYTLASGGNSLGGARCLVVDYSVSGAWGAGTTGAIIYATTSE